MQAPILNISAYKFVALADPAALAEGLQAKAQAADLKGTVLLAGEGINLFLAGAAGAVDGVLDWLRALPEFSDLDVKRSLSARVPFGKLRVKVKAEIIRMNDHAVQPQKQRAPAVDAATLARWLDDGVCDAGRPVVMLDTRNAFEVAHGRFRGALHWQLGRFSDFPQALQAHRDALAGKTVVSYCTGGIRCEKAALHMRQAGIDNVLQLDGGILRYFEHAGAAHFEGNCFVFDERGTLNHTLTPLTAE